MHAWLASYHVISLSIRGSFGVFLLALAQSTAHSCIEGVDTIPHSMVQKGRLEIDTTPASSGQATILKRYNIARASRKIN
jgi:hypothetical protein